MSIELWGGIAAAVGAAFFFGCAVGHLTQGDRSNGSTGSWTRAAARRLQQRARRARDRGTTVSQ